MENVEQNIKNNFEIWDAVNTWVDDGEEWSTHFNDTKNLWDSIIYPKINHCLKGNVLEIAPGRGRITNQLLNCKDKFNLDILDLSSTCIERCKERFGDKIDNYYVGNGKDLKDINTNSKNFVISFDSFVHMHKDVINSYLGEINRVLELGGYCWIHHSNLIGGQDNNFNNIAGRSNMDLGVFKTLAEENQLKVIDQELIKWGAEGNPDWLHDGFSLLKKQIVKV